MLKPRWESWRHNFANLQKVNIARCYVPANFGEVVDTELHHFSDASASGYGQCSYLRVRNQRGEIHCSLVIGKARVSPTKLTTIPRLELTVAVVSVIISNMLREELGYADGKEYFWTDSKVVLGYINNDARRFHTFVANRVQKIRHSTSPQQWLYVPTDKNPADGASWGKTLNELLTSNWFTGPMFPWEKEIPAPRDVIPDLSVGDPEIKRSQTLQTKTTEPVSLADRLSKFSSWSRATKAVAPLLQRAKKIKSCVHSTVSEQESAERVIIQRKTVRSVLNSTLSLSHGRLNDASLRTLLYEAMAVVNSQPLTVDNLNSPDSLQPLTPNYLINMKSSIALPPPGTFPREDLYGAKRWRCVQYLAEQFWSHWKRDYLHNITTRQRWHMPMRNIQVGDIVMDIDELSPRGEWRLARVLETVSGKDGLVRRVKISVGDKRLNKKGERLGTCSMLERPVQKLVLLLEVS